ncbi:hypothetical protein RYX36_013016 [Vicia faba]
MIFAMEIAQHKQKRRIIHPQFENLGYKKPRTMSYPPAANSKTEVRRKRYKVAVDAEEGHRHCENTMVEICKNCREESFLKRDARVFNLSRFLHPFTPLLRRGFIILYEVVGY